MPEAEVDITPGLVTALLGEQHPDLADRTIVELGVGWDNVMYRLGDDLTVRIPRRALAAPLVEYEQRWLPELAPRLPLPISAPVRIGRPSDALGYPWAWSVLPWFEGKPIGLDPPQGAAAERAAHQLGRFLAALHLPAPEDAPVNAGRGVALSTRNERTVATIDAIDSGPERDALRVRWQRCLDQPPYDGPPLWVHGDLHAHNILAAPGGSGDVSAVIDFGDITSGDPATDLAIGFSLFGGTARAMFREAANSNNRPIDDATWIRAEGWSLSVGLLVLSNSADNPAMHAMGQRMVNC